MKQGASEFFPIKPNVKYQGDYWALDGSVHGWEGEFWNIAARACPFIMDYEKDENRLKILMSRQLKGTPRIELTAIPFRHETIYVNRFLSTQFVDDDLRNAKIAYNQGSPEAVWLFLYSGIVNARHFGLSLKDVEAFITTNNVE